MSKKLFYSFEYSNFSPSPIHGGEVFPFFNPIPLFPTFQMATLCLYGRNIFKILSIQKLNPCWTTFKLKAWMKHYSNHAKRILKVKTVNFSSSLTVRIKVFIMKQNYAIFKSIINKFYQVLDSNFSDYNGSFTTYSPCNDYSYSNDIFTINAPVRIIVIATEVLLCILLWEVQNFHHKIYHISHGNNYSVCNGSFKIYPHC